MGAYFISLSNQSVEDKLTAFKQRGQKISYRFESDNIKIVKYGKKLLVNDPWYFEDENHVILAHGTLSYKGLGAGDSFNELVENVTKQRPIHRIFGHYSIVHYLKEANRLKIYYDEAGYGAPYVLNKEFLSTSFLACCEISAQLTLNKDAIFEQIYTGCYFNEDTTFKEIRRITTSCRLNEGKTDIEFKQLIINSPDIELNSRNSVIKYQIKVIENYLKEWLLQINNNYGDLGISSGYDSRLLLSFLNVITSLYQVHCYWKPNGDFDNEIAEKLANIVRKTLISVPIIDKRQISLETLIKNAFWYYDGLFPSNHGWVREYRTIEHRSKILGDARFGLSGISGEQYRNEFQLFDKRYSIDSVIKNIVLEDLNYDVLSSSSYEEKGIKNLRNSITKGLSLDVNTTSMTRYEIHRFYCEMWVKGGPGIRNQIENQLTYFLSPFSDRYLQKCAYQILPFLGYGGKFQAQMINAIDSRLASVLSDYGYSFDKMPVLHDIRSVIGGVLGMYRKRKLASLINGNRIPYLNSFEDQKDEVVDKLCYLYKFNLPFPVDHAKFGSSTVDRLIALSTLLRHFENKIN